MDTSSKNPQEDQKRVLYAFLEYLNQLKPNSGLDEESLESVDVASQCLSNAFGVSLEDPEQKKYSLAPHDLPSIINLGKTGRDKIEQAIEQLHKKNQNQQPEQNNDLDSKFFQYLQVVKKKGAFDGHPIGSPAYEERFQMARTRFLSKYTSAKNEEKKPEQTESKKRPISTEESERAEKLKTEGNQALSSKDYNRAIELYNSAIELNPNSAVYFCNRAAAYSHLGQHERAVEDCQKSIEIDPNYSKAYGRLGLAYFSLGKFQESVNEYKKAVALEPNNASFKDSLAAAEKKIPKPAATATPNFGEMFNNPDVMNNLSSMMGDNPNLGSIFNNPTFQTMAQQMMQNPEIMNMANNMMQNPDAMNNLMNSFGNPRANQQ